MPLKSLTTLWVAIACTFPETNKMSLTRISTRVTSLDYLTVTLPAMGKILDLSLSTGQLQSFTGICSTYKGTHYPIPLREYFELIFDEDGFILPVVDPTLIRKLRTLLFLFYKYEVPFTSEQLVDAHKKFMDVDSSVTTEFSEAQLSALRSDMALALDFDPMAIVGRHSSGATAGGFDNVERRTVFEIIPSLNRVYDLRYFFNSYAHYISHKGSKPIKIHEPTSRVAFVPKDSRGPRTICIEPHCRMYMQQGLMRELYKRLESLAPFRGRVNFTDQSINGRLALQSSVDHRYATLDLKDASDLVSWNLIRQIVPTEWVEPLQALRTPIASLPDGTDVTLKKFAPMGSALCFPIEALLFFVICRTVTTDVYVYGDDIIVAAPHAPDCITALESYGLRVNQSKSFLYGDFRESCGTDAFRGSVVTPIRYRKDDLVSVIAFANNIRSAFGALTGEAVIRWYESFVPLIIPRLPFSFQRSGAIAFFTEGPHNTVMFARRWNKNLQRFELRFLSVTNTTGKVAPDDWDILFDFLSSKEREGILFDKNHYSNEYDFSVNDPLRSDCGRFKIAKSKIGYHWVPDLSQG